MDAVSAHYANLLARHYTWMLGGDLERAAADDRHLLDDLGVTPPAGPGALAVDLGCGPGPTALALADAGFAGVIAVDTSRALLDELARHAHDRAAIRPVEMDLVEALPTVAAPVDLVVCLRDTLLHLPTRAAVSKLAGRVAAALAPGGSFVVSWRDLTRPLEGVDRFLPVRSDAACVMLCALEYAHPDHVTVTDLVSTRSGDGWELHKSSYPKLRLDAAWLHGQLTGSGLEIAPHAQLASGLWATVARRAVHPTMVG